MDSIKLNVTKIALAICAACALLAPTAAFADDANVGGYDDADVAAVTAIIDAVDSSGELSSDPATWGGAMLSDGSLFAVNWDPEAGETPKRVVGITLHGPAFKGELDASGLPLLQMLNCGESGITSIDVSGNAELRDLDCSHSGVTVLDVSANAKLSTLYCQETGLTTLDVTRNAELSMLNCTGTGIASADLSENPRITQAEFGPASMLDVKTDGFSLKLSSDEGGSVSASLYSADGALMVGASCRVPVGCTFARWSGAPSGVDAESFYVEMPAAGEVEMAASFALDPVTLLSSLEVAGTDIGSRFQGDVFEYSATVPFETESVDVKATFEDVYGPHSAITGTGRHALDVGENTITVTLVAPAFPDPREEDMVTREYVIKIDRSEPETPGKDPGLEEKPTVIAQAGDETAATPMLLTAAGSLFLLACFLITRREISS